MDDVVEIDIAAIRQGIDGPEPACLICRETQFGRGLSCSVYFVDRHFAVTELSSHKGHRIRREADRAAMQRAVWQQFWRYLGAA